MSAPATLSRALRPRRQGAGDEDLRPEREVRSIGVLDHPASFRTWLVEHEYESLRQMQGSMGLERCPDPAAFERGNYARVLQSWRP